MEQMGQGMGLAMERPEMRKMCDGLDEEMVVLTSMFARHSAAVSVHLLAPIMPAPYFAFPPCHFPVSLHSVISN